MAVNLSPNEYFNLSDGGVLKNLNDFIKFLENGDSNTFNSHVRDSGNDFYNWVKDCLKEETLAELIKNKRDMKSMSFEINNYFEDKSNNFRNAEDSNQIINGVEDIKVEVKKPDANKLVSKKVSTKENKTKLENPSRSKKPKKEIKPLPTDYKDDFDYSFDLDSEKKDLDRIRERIARLNQDISSSISDSPKKLKMPSQSKKISTPKKTKRIDNSKSLDKVKLKSERSPKKLEHIEYSKPSDSNNKNTNSSKVYSKNSKTQTKQKNNNSWLNKNHINLSLVQSSEKLKQNKLRNDAKNSAKKNIKLMDHEDVNLDHEMKNLYGQSISEAKKSESRNPLFKKLIGKFTSTKRLTGHDLPNLRELEHGKKAQEAFNPYIQIDHPWNYHNHGFPDFIKGLLVGMLIGMLFLALFL